MSRTPALSRTASGAALLCLLLALVLAPPASAQTEVDEDVAYEVLSDGTVDPMALEVTPDGRIIWVERGGLVRVMLPSGVQVAAGWLPVSGGRCGTCTAGQAEWTLGAVEHGHRRIGPNSEGNGVSEGGIQDILLDDEFATNNTVYIYYTPAMTPEEVAPGVFWGEFRLSSFVLDPATNLLDMDSEQEILSVRTEWYWVSHHGGDLDYLPDGTLVLATGDNMDWRVSEGYGPRDHTVHWGNAELTSANPADRRGKVLRFREDGTVPDGTLPGEVPNPFIGMEGHNPYIEDSAENVFVGPDFVNTPGDGWIGFDPYVYAVGYKQPFRNMVMPNGDMYVGDVGPDAGFDDPQRGPRGFEEINLVPFGGGVHHGWPRCVGPNWAYGDVNWETGEADGFLDCSAEAPMARPVDAADPREPITGMTGALMYYPAGRCDGSDSDVTTYDCDRWPIIDNGGGGKTVEPTLFYPADVQGPLALPERYRERMFVLEWSRDLILTIPADPATGELDLDNEDMDLLMPPEVAAHPGADHPQATVSAQQAGRLMSPIDAVIGPDGAVYMLEYGLAHSVGVNGRLVRIRAADAQLDPDANYGLPTTASVAPDVSAAAMGAPSPALLVIGLLVGAGVAMRRRWARVPV